MRDATLSGAMTGYAIALPVGAVAAYLVGLTARTSLRIGAPAALGVATTDGIYALVAVMGGAVSAGVIEPISTPPFGSHRAACSWASARTAQSRRSGRTASRSASPRRRRSGVA